jgi:D-alanine-D-alanine ligase
MKTVLFLFGGQSNEHEVSIVSASNVYENFPRDDYDVLPVYIDKKGVWYGVVNPLVEIPKKLDEVKSFFTEKVVFNFQNGISSIEIKDQKIHIDILYPLIHGTTGEDGIMQGFAKSCNLPVVGPNMETALITFDKDITKIITKSNGVSVAPGIVWYKGDPYPNYKDLVEKYGEKLFIKPARSGSSVGVSCVKNEKELIPALDIAGGEDNKVLIEGAVIGREIEVAVFLKKNGEKYISKVIGEILPPEDNFYTYEEKYANESQTGLVVGAKFTDQEKSAIYETVNKTIQGLNIIGSARIDMFLPDDGIPVLNEVNTIPGCTSISMYPKLFEESGISFKELVKIMIDNAS